MVAARSPIPGADHEFAAAGLAELLQRRARSAGMCLFLGADGGFHWAAAGVIVSLVAGVWNSWILLVEILR
jgi:hypothetical protein